MKKYKRLKPKRSFMIYAILIATIIVSQCSASAALMSDKRSLPFLHDKKVISYDNSKLPIREKRLITWEKIKNYHKENSIANFSDTEFKIEITVRTFENFKNHSDVLEFIDMVSIRNVSIINLNVKQDEDDMVPSGFVFYHSKIAPIAKGYEDFDVLRDVINEAHKRHIQVRAWIPQFHDKAAIEKNPAWQMMAVEDGKVEAFKGSEGDEYFVNPLNNEVQAYEASILKELVSNYDLDGVILDWLRFDDYNMDMSSYTRQKYKDSFGYDPINIDFSTDNERRSQWNNWRTEQLGNYVLDVRNSINAIDPGLSFGVYILPPEFEECGQDAAKFREYVDFVSPMAYFKDWGYGPEWIYEKDSGIISDTKKKVVDKAVIPVFDVTWTNSEYEEIYSGLKKNYTEIKNISYFAYGKWTDKMLVNCIRN